MKNLLLIVPLLGLAGCSLFISDTPFPLVETTSAVVQDCRKVAKFSGPSGYRMWAPPAAFATYKYDTAKKAKEMGATHIYWGEDIEGLEGGIVGYAVDCTGVNLETDENDFE